jgi:Lar family restriction alleviation protein
MMIGTDSDDIYFKDFIYDLGDPPAPPCPFCGRYDLQLRWEKIEKKSYFVDVICQNCQSIGPTAHSEKNAIKLWSKRKDIKLTKFFDRQVLYEKAVKKISSAIISSNKILEKKGYT